MGPTKKLRRISKMRWRAGGCEQTKIIIALSAIALAPPTLIQQSIVAIAVEDGKQKRRHRCQQQHWHWL